MIDTSAYDTTTFEYIWLDANGNTRSKTMVHRKKITSVVAEELGEWNYDGSSTGQAVTENSEVIIKPVKCVKDPFRMDDFSYLVLCETYNTDGTPHETNTRRRAVDIFNMETDHSMPMFGLEQEFFISRLIGAIISGKYRRLFQRIKSGQC